VAEPRTSSVPRTKLCSADKALFRGQSYVPRTKLCSVGARGAPQAAGAAAREGRRGWAARALGGRESTAGRSAQSSSDPAWSCGDV
jgi:hypothetical protein